MSPRFERGRAGVRPSRGPRRGWPPQAPDPRRRAGPLSARVPDPSPGRRCALGDGQRTGRGRSRNGRGCAPSSVSCSTSPTSRRPNSASACCSMNSITGSRTRWRSFSRWPSRPWRTRSDPKEFARAFEDRLVILARAHNLLTREQWTGASFGGDLVDAAMAPARRWRPGSSISWAIRSSSRRAPPLRSASCCTSLPRTPPGKGPWQPPTAGFRSGGVSAADLVAPPISISSGRRRRRPVVAPASTGFGSRLLKASARSSMPGWKWTSR